LKDDSLEPLFDFPRHAKDLLISEIEEKKKKAKTG
jgi:hypothetical protein